MKNFRILLVVSTVLLAANFVLAQTWTQTSAPETNWTAVASSANGTKLVAAANRGGIWVSTNSGATWTQTSAPRTFWVSIASSADGCKLAAAVGRIPTTSGPFYTSTNSGATWILSGAPNTIWLSIASSADGTQLAALAMTGVPGRPDTIYTSTDSGTTWASTNAPDESWKAVASSADGTKLVVVGLFGIYTSTNSGSSWTLINSSLFGASAVASSADGTKLAAIAGSSIYISTNLGMTWTQSSAPATNWIALASSADASMLVAVAGGSHNVQNPFLKGPIYTSTNSGATWTSNNVPVQYWTCVASSADGHKLVAAAAGDPSTNTPGETVGGGIWISQSTPAPQLNIATANTNLDLSWIVPSTNFVMQQSSDLGSWMDMTNKPVLNLTNLQNEVMLSPSSSRGFYRLKTP